ncbi:MAG: hypothetical protein J7521_11785 [Caulobacter sp.]|nr:hypothetical protein [Caulobacter sp.]
MKRAFLALVLVLTSLGAPASAHHSFAMYDQTRIVTLHGTVKTFQWTNPHALIWLQGSLNPNGPAELWSVELSTSPGNLARMGWSKRSLAAGDKVTIDINPLRDGRRGGSLKKAVVLATGQVLTTTPVAGQADYKPEAKQP